MMRPWRKQPTTEVIRCFILLAYTIYLVQPLAISRPRKSVTVDGDPAVNHTGYDDKGLTNRIWNGLKKNEIDTTAKERKIRSINRSKVKQQSFSIKQLKARNVRNGTLSCKSSLYHLAILDNGSVRGIVNRQSLNALFIFENFGNDMVALKSFKSRKYLAMNSKGLLYSTMTFTDEVVLKQKNDQHPYTQFASYKYYGNKTYDMFLAIRSNGLPKKGLKTSAVKKYTKFLIHYK